MAVNSFCCPRVIKNRPQISCGISCFFNMQKATHFNSHSFQSPTQPRAHLTIQQPSHLIKINARNWNNPLILHYSKSPLFWPKNHIFVNSALFPSKLLHRVFFRRWESRNTGKFLDDDVDDDIETFTKSQLYLGHVHVVATSLVIK